MTEVWKSNARKFCEICKVWFADNRVSIEHHESGQKHKNALNQKLRDLGKQSKEKEKALGALHATLAKMEAAAHSSMGETATPSTFSVIGPSVKPKSYMDPRAHGSSVAEMARQLASRKRQQQLAASMLATGAESNEETDETVWVEAKTDTGVSYYFHMFSGATVWEKPANYFTAEQYALKLSSMGESSETLSGSEVIEPSSIKKEPRRQWSHASSSNDVKLPKKKFSQKRDTSSSKKNTKSVKTEIADDTNPIVNAKTTNVIEHDIPLPQTEESAETSSSVIVKSESVEDDVVPETSESNEPPESEQKIKPEKVQEAVDQPSKSFVPRASPYGEWTRVEKSPEPEKIDWQLPSDGEGRKRKPEKVVQPEDAVVFGEKTAALAAKPKSKNLQFEFKKRRTANLSVRQRLDD